MGHYREYPPGLPRAKHMYETYVVEIYSKSQICLCGRMDMALLKSRSSKLHSTSDFAMNLYSFERRRPGLSSLRISGNKSADKSS